MKKSNYIKVLCLTMLFMAFNISSKAQNQSTNNNEWKLIKQKKKGDGWQLYKRKLSDSKFQEVKIVGKINSSMQKAQTSSMEFFVDSTAYISKKGKSLGWFKKFLNIQKMK